MGMAADWVTVQGTVVLADRRFYTTCATYEGGLISAGTWS